MNDITNPHDRLFREIWSDRDTARDFLANYLPPDVLALTDLDSLEICKDSFIEKDLQEYFSDLLYKVQMAGKPGYLYLLLEHKSWPERLVHLQLLEYMLKIWRLHLKQKKGRRLPLVIPMVLYHGRRKWNCPVLFSGILDGPVKEMRRYVPDFEYILHDLTRYSDEEIRGAVLSRVVLMLFKHIFDPDIAASLPRIFELLGELLDSRTGLQYLEVILRYLFNTVENITPNELKRMAEKSLTSEKGGVDMATIAEQIKAEGYKLGKQQGIQMGIRNGMLEAIELGLILKFGEESLGLMSSLQGIEDPQKLRAIKDAIRTVRELSELKKLIEN